MKQNKAYGARLKIGEFHNENNNLHFTLDYWEKVGQISFSFDTLKNRELAGRQKGERIAGKGSGRVTNGPLSDEPQQSTRMKKQATPILIDL